MRRILLGLLIIQILAKSAFACELCSIYNSLDNQERSGQDLFLAVAYQYQNSDSSALPAALVSSPQSNKSQFIHSQTAQVAANYFFSPAHSVQVNLPLIDRSFRRFDGNSFVRGNESGLGDLSLLYKFMPLQKNYATSNYRFELFSGLKLPTGDSGRLGEELDELNSLREELRQTGTIIDRDSGSLIGGDDLALGTGSVDVILGLGFYSQFDQLLLNSNVQYIIRNEGDYEYEYGNDLQWFLSLGRYLYAEHDQTLALNLRYSGEHKAKDRLDSIRLDDSDEVNMFLGPELIYSFSENTLLQFAADFAIKNDNSQNEVASRERFLTSLTHRF